MTFIRALVGAALAACIGVAAISLATIGAVAAPTRVPACASSGPLPGLSTAQAANARVVADVASGRGGRGAALIAVMVALTESNLLVLSNPHDPTGGGYPSQGSGTDHDSLGLFQQRPGWGSASKRMDTTESTQLFVDALLQVDGWESMTPWYAAQTVQSSSFTGLPGAANGGSRVVGENYLRQAGRASAILRIVEGGSAALDCGGAPADALAPAASGAHGLPSAFTLPATTSPAGRTAVAFALAQLGKPYQWGGNGPSKFDCSGLTQQAWRRAGVSIGRVVTQQLLDGSATTPTALVPGDLVMIPGSEGTLASPGHVGMYIGHGLVVNAPRTGDVVRVVSYKSFVSKGLSGLRHIA